MPWDFYVCDLRGQNLPLRYTVASKKADNLEVPCWNFCQQTVSSYSLIPPGGGEGGDVVQGTKRLLLQDILGFRLECLKNKASPKSLTWTQHFVLLSSKWEKQQVSLMLTSLRLLKCCHSFKLNKSGSVAFYIPLCVYVHSTLAWHFMIKSYFLSYFVSDFKPKGRGEHCTIKE